MPSLPHLLNLLLLTTTFSCAAKPKTPKDATLLSSIRTLTLHSSRLTTSRRTTAIPQLTCVSGSGCAHYNVDVMRCTNCGSEYSPEDVSWTCQASLPEEFKLGSTEVVCEGYESPEDAYVLKGSCGVEYRLLLTEKGEEKYGSGSGRGWWGEGTHGKGESYLDEGTGWGGKVFTFIFWAIFLGIVGLIFYSLLFGPPNNNPNNPHRLGYNGGGGGGGGWGGGWGGGGGDDYPSDPPPPYTPDYSSYRKPDPRSPNNSQSWRPGFWTGTAAGAAAAYAMNQTRGGRAEQQGQAGPSNWFGGERQRPAPSRGFGGHGESSAAPSNSRHESTGFGGTRRR